MNTNLEKWRQAYKADSGIFEYCRSFIKQLIDAEGNLQILQLKNGVVNHTAKVIYSLLLFSMDNIFINLLNRKKELWLGVSYQANQKLKK